MRTNGPAQGSAPRRPLRLWPGVLVALAIVFARFVVPLVAPDAAIYGVLAAVAGLLIVIVWWLFFSRAAWIERLGAIAAMAAAIALTFPLLHPSLSEGMQGYLFFVYAVPLTLTLAFVGWSVGTRALPDSLRRTTMVVAILIGCGVWLLLRTEGVKGDALAELEWRWTKTAEQRLLEQPSVAALPSPAPAPLPVERPAEPRPPSAASMPEAASLPAPTTPAAVSTAAATSRSARSAVPGAPPVWPGFRGRERDGVVRGLRIGTDWKSTPPVAVWRRPIGPGWSSFAVDGDVLYTQEQRGEDEIVSAYRVSTGEPVWAHRDRVRFWESNGGAGPRGTPTLQDGRVYAFGATGIVNALDAATGILIWSRNAAADAGVEVPGWGFASSPLVVDDLVVIAASGRLVAYAAGSGEQRWLGPEGGAGYSSPHLVVVDGVPQIVLLRGSRTIAVSPEDGSLLWEHRWQPGVGIVQPAVVDGDILITTGDAMGGVGMQRINVSRAGSEWTTEERWVSRGLKPYFNDFVVHEGHGYGFDGSILSCIDVATGERRWKGGRYGQGQMILLPDQDLLLVLSEDGELALVRATSHKYEEVAKAPGIEGKTWNHPALIGDLLLVRNGEEMAAFRLPPAGR